MELLREYGFWAAGWRWAASEPGCGGPVRAWCCGPHSLPTARSEDRIAAALADWNSWLETLRATFDALDRETSGLPASSRIERAAARLLSMVIARTSCEDAWYQTYETTLSWYIDRLAPCENAAHWLPRVIGGRFESWVAPTSDLSARVCADVGTAVRAARSTDDALALWLDLRSRATWRHERLHPSTTVAFDGHLAYVERCDAGRDPVRAERMRDALAQIRHAALRGEPLAWSMLAHCQRTVLGLAADAPFRRGDAYAKGGNERYALSDHTQRDFERCLAEANDAATPPVDAAARVYLDVCFFHPFDDGNARAARLALDYVLTRAGLALHVAEPVFAISRWADDVYCVPALTVLLDRLVGTRRT